MSGKISFFHFEDVDRFREVLRGWDTEPTQITCGRLTVDWEQLAFDDLVISRLRTDRKIADRTAYQSGHIGFVICLSSKIFCGISVPAGSLVVFGPGREYRNILDENWHSFEIGMSLELFQSMPYAASVSRRLALGPERSVMPLSPNLTTSFRDWSANFLSPFRLQINMDETPFWADVVRERTLALLHDAMHENGNIGTSTHPLDHVHNWGLASRALECVDRRGHGRLSVHHICKELGCTTRALQYAFQTTLDLTPLQYVLTRRLHLARRELLSVSSGSSSVTKAAANQGFQNFGRFSHYYQVLFGELPSDTLRRREMVTFRRNGKLW